MNSKCRHINKHLFTLESLSYKRKKKKRIKESGKLKENHNLLLICTTSRLPKWPLKTISEPNRWPRRILIDKKLELIDKRCPPISLTISRVYFQ